jgi:hypothetical protein
MAEEQQQQIDSPTTEEEKPIFKFTVLGGKSVQGNKLLSACEVVR